MESRTEGGYQNLIEHHITPGIGEIGLLQPDEQTVTDFYESLHSGTQKPFTPVMVRRMHDEIIQEAGLDHIRFEDLRHTCAVNALQNGMEVRKLSQILGHTRTSLTRQNYSSYIRQTVPTEAEAKYEEPELEELKEASAQMENLLGL